MQRLLYLVSAEGGEGEHSAAANRRAVVEGAEDGRERDRVTQGTEGGDGGLAYEGVGVFHGDAGQGINSDGDAFLSDVCAFAERAGRGLGDEGIGVVEQGNETLADVRSTRDLGSPLGRPPPDGAVGVGGGAVPRVRSGVEPHERPEGGGAHAGIRVGVHEAAQRCNRAGVGTVAQGGRRRRRGAFERVVAHVPHLAKGLSDADRGPGRGTLVSPVTEPTSTTLHHNPVLRLAAGVLLLVYSLVMFSFVPFPYITIEPGSAAHVHELISVDGSPTFEPSGRLLYLTVSLSHRLTLAEVLYAWTQDDVKVVEERAYTGPLSREELLRLNLAIMEQSELLAIKVALEHLGFEVERLGGGALVRDVIPGFPAEGKVHVGDVLVAINGKPVIFESEAVDAVRAHSPGEEIALTVTRGGEQHDITLKTRKGPEGHAQVGLDLENTFQFRFPISVDIDTGTVGGPSAGLAFTLALIDELTEGELTGGNVVAVTGEIDDTGRVRPVGGVAQKASAARRAGAVLMIVPKGEKKEAQGVAGDMKVVEVEDLEAALEALADIGGNGLALAPLATAAGTP